MKKHYATISFQEFKAISAVDLINDISTKKRRLSEKEVAYFPSYQSQKQGNLLMVKRNVASGRITRHNIKIRKNKKNRYVLIDGIAINIDNMENVTND